VLPTQRPPSQHPFDSRQSPPPLQTWRRAPPRSPAPVSTGGRSGVGKSSYGQDEHSRIVLPPETGEHPSLSSGLSDAPWVPLSLNTKSTSSSSLPPRGRPRPFIIDRLRIYPEFLKLCECLLLQDLLQSCSRGGRGTVEDMCYERRRAEALED
jgi:hypothetical protein